MQSKREPPPHSVADDRLDFHPRQPLWSARLIMQSQQHLEYPRNVQAALWKECLGKPLKGDILIPKCFERGVAHHVEQIAEAVCPVDPPAHAQRARKISSQRFKLRLRPVRGGR